MIYFFPMLFEGSMLKVIMKKSEILNWVVRGMSFILLTYLNNHHVYLMINRILLRVTKMFLRYFRKKYNIRN